MTLFEVELDGVKNHRWCVDLDTISSFYIGSGDTLHICPKGSNAYIAAITICDYDAQRLFKAWRGREDRINAI